MAISPLPLNQSKLCTAINRAAANLRTILENPDIEVYLVPEKDVKTKKDASAQWAANQDGFNWSIYIDKTDNNENIVAIYTGTTLSGLCLYKTEKQSSGRSKIKIHTIEGKQEQNPLEGFIIPAFAEVAVEIAKSFSIGEIAPLVPENNTIPSYLRAGFYCVTSPQAPLMTIDHNSKVNWHAVLGHQKSKGRSALTNHQSPAQR